MGRIVSFTYGLICYVLFLASFIYAAGFLANLWVPKSIDSGDVGPIPTAILVNVLLLGVFAIQHSVMARPGFKTWWTRLVPVHLERSTYVLLSVAAFALLFWQWRPMPATVWKIEHATGAMVLQGLLFSGFLLVVYASFLIDHFDLFGLRQVFLHLRGIKYQPRPFRVPALYKVVRHPLYVGWFIAFWCTPHMTQGHLLFAAVASAYIFVAIVFEERDLVRFLGEDYRSYRQRVPMIFPWPKKKPARVTST